MGGRVHGRMGRWVDGRMSRRTCSSLLLSLVLFFSLDVSIVAAPGRQRSGDRQIGRQNTWSARSNTGLTLNGTWTVTVDPKTGAAGGTWTLLDASGQAAMRGGWSAAKSATAWNGAWRANVVGSAAEYGGTWSATVPLKPNAPFADLFALAAQQVVSGNWRAGGKSGSWSIRAFTSD
jgi:hypothetical protein